MTRSSPESPYVLVAVMEHGSRWPSCIQHCRSITPDSVVIAQDAGETPTELATRVHRRVRALSAEGRRVGTGVIAAAPNPAMDGTADVISARVQIALTLLQSMRRGNEAEGKLCLVGSEQMEPDARQQLMALTGMLMSELSGPPPVIDVRFGDDALAGYGQACPHAHDTQRNRAVG